MKKIILVGTVACGKTTLCQRLNGMECRYKKTQAIEIVNQTIDTPGEYLEHRSFLQSLVVTSVETDVVLFVIDPTQVRFMYSPGQSAAFPVQVAGVVTKTDLATEEERRGAHELLELAGASPIFEVSSITGAGMEELLKFLSVEPEKQRDTAEKRTQ
jgi:ethanolamine utilization protein EutP